MAKLKGLAVPFFSMSEDLGGYIEQIESSAININDFDVRILYQHNDSELLGRTSSGTLKLFEKSDGIHFELDLPETTLANDLSELIKRGDLFGCSFRMFVNSDQWNYDESPARRIIQNAYIDEISIVGVPAYSSTYVEVA